MSDTFTGVGTFVFLANKNERRNEVLDRTDRLSLYRWGRDYALTGNADALKCAREYLELAASVAERNAVANEWEEGTRNYASYADHAKECMSALWEESA